jgi:hypothetical protein
MAASTASAVGERLAGKQVSRPRAFVAAVTAGAVVYALLRAPARRESS